MKTTSVLRDSSCHSPSSLTTVIDTSGDLMAQYTVPALNAWSCGELACPTLSTLQRKSLTQMAMEAWGPHFC